MIVVDRGESLRIVAQTDHARFSGELLALWRRDGLPAHPRRNDLLFAVREHDNGWREADAAPRVDPKTGRPHDFRSLPDEPRRELWRRGTERYAETRPYAGLLILEHARTLHLDRRGRGPWDGWLDELEERREELLAAWGGTEEELAGDYRWLALADRLSLAACCGSDRNVADPEYRAFVEEGGLRLDPFPLTGGTRFRIPARTVPARAYRGDADFGAHLAAARWDAVTVRVAAAAAE